MVSPPTALSGLSEILDRFDGFILDIWGVVHDGTRLYPGVAETLERLQAARKRYVFLTNAPRRIADVASLLDRLGLDQALRPSIVSSGEAARHAMEARGDPFHASLGRDCFVFGDMQGSDLLAGLGTRRVERLEDASFVFNIGPWGDGATLDDYEDVIARAASLDLPMVCANPDLRVMRGDVELICAGALAARFEELGGRVFYHGKPHPAIYETCFETLGGLAVERILAVGDYLGTDIKGAAAAGLSSALVLGGLHAGADALEPLFERHGVRPTYTLPRFTW